MAEFLNGLGAFYGVVVVIVVLMLLAVFWKRGRSGFIAYFKTGDGAGALASALKASAAIAIILMILFVGMKCAHADDEWFKWTDVYMGVDYTKKQSPQCNPGGVDDNFTSNLGVSQHIRDLGSEDVYLYGGWTHHSCVIGGDRNTFDGVGIGVNWRFNW